MAGRQKSGDETRRLEVLRALQILDTDPEEEFDRIARLASAVFRAPIAHFSLIDEHREWFKAACGIAERQGDRRTAFCAHTILDDGVLVIEDAAEDERFRENPQVVGNPSIRFYAGAPVTTPSGHRVGALCVKDYQPRTFSQADADILRELATVVATAMQHRLAAASLQRWSQIFERVAWGVVVGSSDGKRIELMNPAFADMHGYSIEELTGRPIETVFAPEVRHQVSAYVREAHERGHYVFESMHVRKDGTTFPVQGDASTVRDEHGRILFRAVHVQDITGRKRMEDALRNSEAISRKQLAELELIYATAPVGLCHYAVDGRIVRINERLAALGGLSVADHIGRGLSEVAPGVARQVGPLLERVIETGVSILDIEVTAATPARPSMVGLLSFHPLKGESGGVEAVSVVVQDITDRKRAEQAVRDSRERLSRILESAMDAIITIDTSHRIHVFNRAAESIFRCTASEALGSSLDRFTTPTFRDLVVRTIGLDRTAAGSHRSVWAPQGLMAVRADGDTFSAEATISPVETEKERLFTIILRDNTDRARAEQELRRLQAEVVYLREEAREELEFGEIVGNSPAIRDVLESVRQVANTDSTVLITGETGTGKELVARAIHETSERSDKLLVKINCAALPGGLIESELFGHEQGAFTGALTRKAGRFEMADRGTILLDEIGDLPIELQAKLLRVLQEGEFERVGGTETLTADVRVIAATNRALEGEVKAKKFRSDLYYRLNVFPIRVPPLRERREDVKLLARHFAMRFAAKLGKRIDSISKSAMQALMGYDWPGNVRELQNVIERAVILTKSGSLELLAWPPPRPAESAERAATALEDVERRHILTILEGAGWRISGPNGAAALLGLKPTTLHARMKKLGIERPA